MARQLHHGCVLRSMRAADGLGFQAALFTLLIASHHEELAGRATDEHAGELRRVVKDSARHLLGEFAPHAQEVLVGEQVAGKTDDPRDGSQVGANLCFDAALQVADDAVGQSQGIGTHDPELVDRVADQCGQQNGDHGDGQPDAKAPASGDRLDLLEGNRLIRCCCAPTRQEALHSGTVLSFPVTDPRELKRSVTRRLLRNDQAPVRRQGYPENTAFPSQ
jgi:hypothetical protein